MHSSIWCPYPDHGMTGIWCCEVRNMGCVSVPRLRRWSVYSSLERCDLSVMCRSLSFRLQDTVHGYLKSRCERARVMTVVGPSSGNSFNAHLKRGLFFRDGSLEWMDSLVRLILVCDRRRNMIVNTL